MAHEQAFRGVASTSQLRSTPSQTSWRVRRKLKLIVVNMLKLRGLRSTHYKHTKGALIELQQRFGKTANIMALWSAFDAWPSSSTLHRMTLDEMCDHVDEASALCGEVLNLLAKYEENSARPEENGASYIQDSNQDSDLSCNASDIRRTEDKSSEVNSHGASPNGSAPCLEKRMRKIRLTTRTNSWPRSRLNGF